MIRLISPVAESMIPIGSTLPKVLRLLMSPRNVSRQALLGIPIKLSPRTRNNHSGIRPIAIPWLNTSIHWYCSFLLWMERKNRIMAMKIPTRIPTV